MKHHGMIFNAEMVRAILDVRKTQTRRPYKGCKPTFYPSAAGGCWGIPIGEREKWPIKVGDIIWVRETFYEAAEGGVFAYGASDEMPESAKRCGCKWTPSIHMPRWASRIDLEVTAVRVERVQDISEEDARKEGVTPMEYEGMEHPDNPWMSAQAHRDAFRDLWQSIYSNWDANPFVWVYEFRRVK
jgi:hypothetical protein